MSKIKQTLDRHSEVIKAMMGKKSLTLAEISSSLKISLPVVTNIVHQLSLQKIVIENTNTEQVTPGRPAIKFQLNSELGYTIGIEAGRIYTNYVVLDYTQNMIYNCEKKTILTKPLNSAIKQLAVDISSVLDELKISKDKILAIGIAIPGIVHGKKGISETYLKLENKTIQEVLEKKFKVPVRIEHDVKSMALGELYYGAARDVDNALYLNYGWGLGLGIIFKNELYYGNDGYSGEFGHIQLDPNGELCYCGKHGCLETLSSGRAITKKVREKLSAGGSSIILRTVKDPEKIDPMDILKAVNYGDQFSIEILEEAGKYLGIGIALLINIFNPGKIIIGGTISQLANYLLDFVKNNAMKHSLVQLNKNVVFEISSLGHFNGALGAARIASMENCSKHLLKIKKNAHM